MELPRKGSAKGGGIRDARAKAHPVNWLTPEAQDPETQPHFAHSGGRDSCTAFYRLKLARAVEGGHSAGRARLRRGPLHEPLDGPLDRRVARPAAPPAALAATQAMTPTNVALPPATVRKANRVLP